MRRLIFSMLGLGVAASASATVMVELSIEQMAQESAAVVRGRVLGQQADWDGDHRRIYTTTRVEVLDPIWARGGLDPEIQLRTLGGMVGDVGMKVAGTPEFQVGEEVVVFLRPEPQLPGKYAVIGMGQGKFKVQRGPNGQALAVPSLEGIAFAQPGAGGRLQASDPTGRTSQRLSLEELTRRVRGAVSGGAPVPVVPIAPVPAAPGGTTTR